MNINKGKHTLIIDGTPTDVVVTDHVDGIVYLKDGAIIPERDFRNHKADGGSNPKVVNNIPVDDSGIPVLETHHNQATKINKPPLVEKSTTDSLLEMMLGKTKKEHTELTVTIEIPLPTKDAISIIMDNFDYSMEDVYPIITPTDKYIKEAVMLALKNHYIIHENSNNNNQ